MKQVKAFRISEENQQRLGHSARVLDRTEGWIINKALQKWFALQPLPERLIL